MKTLNVAKTDIFATLTNTLNYLLTHHVDKFAMVVQHYMFAGIWFNQVAYF